jgi:hypothetical protein
MPTKKAASTNKTYILELKNGDTRKVTVPSHWKMTYGSLVPFKAQGGVYEAGRSGVALRFYEGTKENLRAVMTDVVAIRDADMAILEKRTTVQRKSAQRQTNQGAKDVVIEARMTEWVNPDDEDASPVPTEFLKLPVTPHDEDE